MLHADDFDIFFDKDGKCRDNEYTDALATVLDTEPGRVLLRRILLDLRFGQPLCQNDPYGAALHNAAISLARNMNAANSVQAGRIINEFFSGD